MIRSLAILAALVCLPSAHADPSSPDEPKPLLSRAYSDMLTPDSSSLVELKDDGLFYSTRGGQTRIVGRLQSGSLALVRRNIARIAADARLVEGPREELCETDGVTFFNVHDARFEGGKKVILQDEGCAKSELENRGMRLNARNLVRLFDQVHP